jgi:thiol-disulfide isomerase/thioredoxin
LDLWSKGLAAPSRKSPAKAAASALAGATPKTLLDGNGVDFIAHLSYFKAMRILMTIVFVMAVIVLATPCSTLAQARVPVSAPGKTIFRDSDGNLIPNNEFVDIRMANFTYPDATIVKSYEDGTVEFRLQKVAQEGGRAPEFSVRTLDGKTLSYADLKGKVVVLNFWFIGCPACLDLEPKLNVFKAKFTNESDVVFLAMTRDPANEVKKYLSKERFDYLQAVDAEGAMRLFGFSGFPKNIVISRSGEIVYWRSGIRSWDKFESVVRAELAKQKNG